MQCVDYMKLPIRSAVKSQNRDLTPFQNRACDFPSCRVQTCSNRGSNVVPVNPPLSPLIPVSKSVFVSSVSAHASSFGNLWLPLVTLS